MLSCEFSEIFKNIFFTEHLWWLLLKVIKKTLNEVILVLLITWYAFNTIIKIFSFNLNMHLVAWYNKYYPNYFSPVTANLHQMMINKKIHKQQPEVFYKKAILKNFAIFNGKQLCWSLFLIKFFFFNKYSNKGIFL